MKLSEHNQNMIMDRAFDAACLYVKGEEEWCDKIMNRLISTYPELEEYCNNLFNFYVNMVTANNDFLSRADYMIEHRETIRLQYK